MLVPVRVKLAGSNEASQPMYTLDATERGVRLAGFRGEVNVGDIIEIQYRHQKALFRVVWIHTPGNVSEKHIGAECVEDKNIWGEKFPQHSDEYAEEES